MITWTCRRWRRALARLARGTLGGEEHNRLREHLRGCEACRRRYLRVIAVERLLVHGDPARLSEPTHFERERLAQRIWVQAQPRAPRWLGRWPAAAAWVASSAVLLLVGGLLFRHLGSRQTGELTARGGAPSARVAIRVLRLHDADGGRKLGPPLPARVAGGPGRVLLQDSMVLLYTNRGPARYGFVVGVDRAWQPRWYFPTPEEGISPRLAPQVVDRALGQPIRLSLNHGPGPLTIFGLVTSRPVSIREVQEALDRSRPEGKTPMQRERLPLSGVEEQVRLDLLLE